MKGVKKDVDFFKITMEAKKDGAYIYPNFLVDRVKDLMVRGHAFYAVWDEESGLWSRLETDVARLVDNELRLYSKPENCKVKWMSDFNSNSWTNYCKYVRNFPDNYVDLDTKVIFADTETKREDYASRKLPYSLDKRKPEAYEELMSVLYSPEERDKIEWAIGSVFCGERKDIQKFLVFYGDAGTGKSTVLDIIQQLFEGYYVIFDAKALVANNNSFATEMFRSNPLVAIQHDGDLSRIEDNTKLNSIVSHEEIVINEKYKSGYISRANAFLFLASNKPVMITDAKSGLLRRLIDVTPTGNKIPLERYFVLKEQIKYELGSIAYLCIQKYKRMGKGYYNSYRPLEMQFKTDTFFNFVDEYYLIFASAESVTLAQAYDYYKEYCTSGNIQYQLSRPKFREELKNYFEIFQDRARVDGKQVRNVYSGFKTEKFNSHAAIVEPEKLSLKCTESIFDQLYSDQPAQEALDDKPKYKWDNVKTTLKDIDTHQVHYILLPDNHIVIDFDLKNELGEKDLERNLIEAAKFPPTYAELSKSGTGVHLHYIYSGDVSMLAPSYSDGIEIKVFTGKSSLRRKLTLCNNTAIFTLNGGLPLKGDKKMINFEGLANEKAIRTMIEKNLRKEIHPGTKPSIDFIFDILEDAYSKELEYDVSDLRGKILKFAASSTNHSDYCVKKVSQMKFSYIPELQEDVAEDKEAPIVFFDVEVFPNLFLINWKYDNDERHCIRMINPEPEEVKELFKFRLIGFNCRRYDNHILYARAQGYSVEELYKLSQRIINTNQGLISNAYNISYTDVYDFASAGNKKSLKKFEIELGLHHMELGLPWDEPVPESDWIRVAEYCDNDVISTQKVFHHLKGDWTARQILAALSGLTVNDTTNSHTTKIIFGNDKNPQSKFVYTDLSTIFPGYTFENGKSSYRGEDPGEGGYVYSEPGMYENVALLDVASMHPTSIEQLNLFGPYTAIFSDLKAARVAIKHKDYDAAKLLLDGKLEPYLNDPAEAKDLSNALKTVINSVYGLTSAKFDNKFRDPRNIDNIVAKRGALFMIDLKHAVQEKGYTVAHIKTDSIKIPNADQEIIDFVTEFGKKYGYIFEHEDTYQKMCLVNDAVYICKKGDGHWEATGAQFAHPFVFKTLFSHEPIEFEDMCETRSVSTALYLDMNQNLPDGEHNYIFVGKTGLFCPMESGGGELVRIKDDKYYAVSGTKGYRWLESEMVDKLGKKDLIDKSYFMELANEAVKDISQYGDYEWFVE